MDLNRRFKIASQYLDLESKIDELNWDKLFCLYNKGELLFPEKLILIHPRLVRNKLKKKFSSSEVENIYSDLFGQRTYKVKESKSMTCQASKLWGYQCTFQSKIHQDHYFPFGKGGPTINSNLLFLCEIHNHLKGSDIHLFCWEEGLPDWFDGRLNQISSMLDISPV